LRARVANADAGPALRERRTLARALLGARLMDSSPPRLRGPHLRGVRSDRPLRETLTGARGALAIAEGAGREDL